MPTPQELAERFRSLHVAGKPLILFNIWDAGSAKAVIAGGAVAVGTGSWSVAAANGYDDGEQLPFEFVIANLKRIIGAAQDVPVTVDLESGYGEKADEVARSVARVIEVGIVGCNLEDSLPGDGALRDPAENAKRIARARSASDSAGIPFFINARIDCFLQAPRDGHDLALLRSALERGRAYADVGADGLFLPGLVDPGLIERAVAQSPLPINIMKSAQAPSHESLAGLGVARISHGPGPYRAVMDQLAEGCRAAMRGS